MGNVVNSMILGIVGFGLWVEVMKISLLGMLYFGDI